MNRIKVQVPILVKASQCVLGILTVYQPMIIHLLRVYNPIQAYDIIDIHQKRILTMTDHLLMRICEFKSTN